MKRNVDLSENRIFTTPEEPTGDEKIILDWVKKVTRKPWDFKNKPKIISSDFDLEISCKEKELFFTGDKKERQIKKQNRLFDEEKVCDVCGLDTRKKPWARTTCKCYSMKYESKKPWIF